MTAYALHILLLLGAHNTAEVRTGAAEIATVCKHEARPRFCVRVLAVIWAHEAHFVRVPRERGGGRGPCQVAKVSPGYASIDPKVPLTGFRAGLRTWQAKMKRAKGDVRRAFELYAGTRTARRFGEWAMLRMEVIRRAGVGRAAAAARVTRP